jgi:predicted metal-dependent hydrolase
MIDKITPQRPASGKLTPRQASADVQALIKQANTHQNAHQLLADAADIHQRTEYLRQRTQEIIGKVQ